LGGGSDNEHLRFRNGLAVFFGNDNINKIVSK
jgi:hypothetical protein